MKTNEVNILSDEQLVREYLKGDNSSLGILYSRYYSKVYHKCLSFSRDRDFAFDLAQDVLLKAFSNMGSFKGESKFSTWLYAITSNYCLSHIAKPKNEFYHIPGAEYNYIADNTDEEEFKVRNNREEMELRIDEYLLLLTENERKMLNLKYRMDYSIKDLQKEFKLSSSAVKMRLMRARNKMAQIISDVQAA